MRTRKFQFCEKRIVSTQRASTVKVVAGEDTKLDFELSIIISLPLMITARPANITALIKCLNWK